MRQSTRDRLGNRFSRVEMAYDDLMAELRASILMAGGSGDADYGEWLAAELFVTCLNNGIRVKFTPPEPRPEDISSVETSLVVVRALWSIALSPIEGRTRADFPDKKILDALVRGGLRTVPKKSLEIYGMLGENRAWHTT